MRSTSRYSSKIIPEHVASIESSEQSHEDILEEDDSEAPRRSKRQRIGKFFGDDFTVYLVDDTPTSIVEEYAFLDADDWKKLSRVRWTPFFQIGLGRLLNDSMAVNLWVVGGCSRRSLGLIVLLRSTRLGL